MQQIVDWNSCSGCWLTVSCISKAQSEC